MLVRDYDVPLNEIRCEHQVVNSRFVATIAPAFNIEEARSFMARIKREFADANHNVSVYLIGGGNTLTEYFSDDGEPGGTAGKPALAVLRGSSLGDVVLVITRYFGGTLLGTGGLVKAYTESAQMAVSAVERGKRVPIHIVMIAIPYNLLERMRLLIPRHHGQILGEDFAGDITLTIQLPVSEYEVFQLALRELSAGKFQPEVIESKETIVAA